MFCSPTLPLKKDVRRKLLMREIDEVMCKLITWGARAEFLNWSASGWRHSSKTTRAVSETRCEIKGIMNKRMQLSKERDCAIDTARMRRVPIPISPFTGRCYGCLDATAQADDTMKCLLNSCPAGGTVRLFAWMLKAGKWNQSRLAYVRITLPFIRG